MQFITKDARVTNAISLMLSVCPDSYLSFSSCGFSLPSMLSIALRSFVTGIAPVARSVGMRSLAIAIKVQGEDGVVRDVAGKPDQTLLEACQAANVPLGGTCGGMCVLLVVN